MTLRATRKRLSFAALSVGIASFVVPAHAQDATGYANLASRGVLQRNGAGQQVLQVEAVGATWGINTSNPEFSGKNITSVGNAGASDHATWVGSMIFGNNTGIARRAAQIRVMNSDHFLTGSGLNTGTTSAPFQLNVDVINNSWVAAYDVAGSHDYNVEAVRRLDWMIARDDVVVVNALDNSPANAYPKLLAPAYNGITVGLSSGNHSLGPIDIDTSGGSRIKPDLVATAGNTSQAAALVSGSAALLRSEADARGMNLTDMATKAVLMAGADRPSDWTRGGPGRSDDARRSLDYKLGAGVLQVDDAFDIMARGEKNYGNIRPSGWDHGVAKIGTRKPRAYTIRLSQGADFDAFLTWERDIATAGNTGSILNLSPDLANLDLRFDRKKGDAWKTVAESKTRFDNVESLTLRDLRRGTYRLTVLSDEVQEYGLAWRSRGGGASSLSGLDNPLDPAPIDSTPIPFSSAPSFGGSATASAVPEPAALLVLPAAAFLARRRRK